MIDRHSRWSINDPWNENVSRCCRWITGDKQSLIERHDTEHVAPDGDNAARIEEDTPLPRRQRENHTVRNRRHACIPCSCVLTAQLSKCQRSQRASEMYMVLATTHAEGFSQCKVEDGPETETTRHPKARVGVQCIDQLTARKRFQM